jgi:hypothetical protein
MLANGDLLRVEAVPGRGLVVRRALDADPRTGARRWTDRCFLYGDYRNCELGYAVTDHVAQSRTVHTGLALITGTEDRQHAYEEGGTVVADILGDSGPAADYVCMTNEGIPELVALTETAALVMSARSAQIGRS